MISFQEFLMNAPAELWEQWEQDADALELPLDYYIMEFVGQF